MMMDERHEAVRAEIGKIDQSEFVEYGGGWKGEVGTSLVDAVFSIRARYQATGPGKGVLGRVRMFRDEHPEATDDLHALVSLGESEIQRIMGGTLTSGRPKSECVIEAAQRLLSLDPSIATAEAVVKAGPNAVKEAYTGVTGLGWVTCEYFLMLLGVPGIKADTMIVGFVNEALVANGFKAVGAAEARQFVVDAHATNARGVGLSAYDHAIWRTKGQLVVDEGPGA